MKKLLGNEKGSALVISLLMIALMSLIGVFAVQSSKVENRISGNDRLHKKCFHLAEGGIQLGKELLEQNLYDRGFEVTTKGNVKIENQVLYANSNPPKAAMPGDCDAYFPVGAGPNDPRTYISIGASTPRFAPGSSIHMVAGYDRLGKSVAAGGSYTIYDIRSSGMDVGNSRSRILSQYRHMTGSE